MELVSEEKRLWAMASHLSLLIGSVLPAGSSLFPLTIYLIKKDDDPYVAEHARAALRFSIPITVIGVVLVIAQSVFGSLEVVDFELAQHILFRLGQTVLTLLIVFIGFYVTIEAIVNSTRAYKGDSPKYLLWRGSVRSTKR